MGRRGDRSSGELRQPEQVSRWMQMTGEEATPVFRQVTMAPSIPVVPQSSRTAPYTTETPTVPPECYGPVRTPLRRPAPTRMEAAVAAPEPSPQTPAPRTDHVLYTYQKGRRHASDQRLITVRGQPVALLREETVQGCYLLTWKTQPQHTKNRERARCTLRWR